MNPPRSTTEHFLSVWHCKGFSQSAGAIKDKHGSFLNIGDAPADCSEVRWRGETAESSEKKKQWAMWLLQSSNHVELGPKSSVCFVLMQSGDHKEFMRLRLIVIFSCVLTLEGK